MVFIVYGLLKNNEIVYIGRANGLHNLKQRLYYHSRTKDYDEYIYRICESYESQKETERRLIKEIMPAYNKQGVPGRVKQKRIAYYTRR